MNQSNIQDRGLRSLIDLSPIQPQRDIPTLLPTLVGGVEGNQRSFSDGFPKTVLTMAALKGTRRLYVQDQTGFRIGRIVIIHDLFAAQIVAYGSIVIDRPVDRDYPIGSTVRELTPEDDHRVDSQGRTFINGVAMDPGDFGSNPLSLENQPESGRQIPPIPEDGMLVNLDNESKLHAWLLQGMTKTGRTHWKECADYLIVTIINGLDRHSWKCILKNMVLSMINTLKRSITSEQFRICRDACWIWLARYVISNRVSYA